MGTFYRSQHELILVFKVGDAPHTNNFGLGATGRYRTNVWTYPGISSPTADRQASLEMHPTVKPTQLVMDAIQDCSKRGQVVLDSFAGSGTTLIAADRCGRTACVIEFDPHYCDTIVRGWQILTGKQANPRGRPRKPKPDSTAGQTSIHDLVLADSQLPVTIKQNEEVVGTLPTAAAVLRRMRSAALEGNGIAQRRYLLLMQAARDQKRKEQLAAMEAMADYVRRCEAKIASCTAGDEEAPDFLPHPHDVVIDLERGQIKINGPATEAEKMLWEQAESDRQTKTKMVEQLFLTANDPLCEFHIGDVEAVIRKNMEEIVKLDRVYPSADTRRRAGFDLEEHRRQKDKAVIALPPDNRRRKIKKRTYPAPLDPRQMPCVKNGKAAARQDNDGKKMRQTSSPAYSIADRRKRNIARNAAAIISQAKA